jgi:hypothetical protein
MIQRQRWTGSFLEHLAFKGTQNVKGEEFQRRLDQYTLMTNASTIIIQLRIPILFVQRKMP